MKKFVAFLSVGLAGMKQADLIEARDEEAALEVAREMCVDFASSYGYEQDYDYFGDNDQLGCDWDEEDEEYTQTGELDYYVEEYDAEEHDGYL